MQVVIDVWQMQVTDARPARVRLAVVKSSAVTTSLGRELRKFQDLGSINVIRMDILFAARRILESSIAVLLRCWLFGVMSAGEHARTVTEVVRHHTDVRKKLPKAPSDK